MVITNKIASDDAERVEQPADAERLAERCAELLRALPMGRGRNLGNVDGPWDNWYEQQPGKMLTDLKRFIRPYLQGQRKSRQPGDRSRQRKDFDDMHKAAVKFAASIRRFGVRDLVDVVDPNPPDFEALLANLERATMWMENNPFKYLWPSRSKKGNARGFVGGGHLRRRIVHRQYGQEGHQGHSHSGVEGAEGDCGHHRSYDRRWYDHRSLEGYGQIRV